MTEELIERAKLTRVSSGSTSIGNRTKMALTDYVGSGIKHWDFKHGKFRKFINALTAIS